MNLIIQKRQTKSFFVNSKHHLRPLNMNDCLLSECKLFKSQNKLEYRSGALCTAHNVQINRGTVEKILAADSLVNLAVNK